MLNKAMLIGNVGKDPEVRDTNGGGKVARFSIATTNKYKNKEGEKIEDTTWHNCVAFGKTAEVIGEYVNKGARLYVEGRIDNRKVESDDGPAKFFSSIVVEKFHFLSAKKEGGGEKPNRDKVANADDFVGDDEIPY